MPYSVLAPFGKKKYRTEKESIQDPKTVLDRFSFFLLSTIFLFSSLSVGKRHSLGVVAYTFDLSTGRWRQVDRSLEFEASVVYIVKPYESMRRCMTALRLFYKR